MDPRDRLVQEACESMRGLKQLVDFFFRDPISFSHATTIVITSLNRSGMILPQRRRRDLIADRAEKLQQLWAVKLVKRRAPLNRLQCRTYKGFVRFSRVGMKRLLNDLLVEDSVLGNGTRLLPSEIANGQRGTLVTDRRLPEHEAQTRELRERLRLAADGSARIRAAYKYFGLPFKKPKRGTATLIASSLRQIAAV